MRKNKKTPADVPSKAFLDLLMQNANENPEVIGVRRLLKELRKEKAMVELMDYKSQLDPNNDFKVTGMKNKSREAVEDEFREYLALVYGIEPEEFPF